MCQECDEPQCYSHGCQISKLFTIGSTFFHVWPLRWPGGRGAANMAPTAAAAAGGSRGSKKIRRPDLGLNPQSRDRPLNLQSLGEML